MMLSEKKEAVEFNSYKIVYNFLKLTNKILNNVRRHLYIVQL
jgi:hypothetical protein